MEPGAIDTELFTKVFKPEQLDGVRQTFRKLTLTGEIGKPEDMSEAYLYIMKDAFMTGQTVLSEGGMLLSPGVSSSKSGDAWN